MKLCLFFFWMKPPMAYQIKSEVLTMPVRSLQDLVSTYLSNFISDYSSHLYYNMLAIYNCITNYPRLTGLKQQIFIIWQFLWVRNSGLAYLVGFGSGFLMRLQTRCWLGLQPLLTHGLGLRDPIPRCLTQTVVGKRSYQVGLSIRLVKVLTMWYLTSPKVSDRRENKEKAAMPFMAYSQKSHTITSAILCLLAVCH